MLLKEIDLLEDLNEAQREAVATTEGPLLVLAGAGSGKTRVVTYRIANLLTKGVQPNRILGVTFTNKAAGEMKERIQSLTDSHVLICTFHSLGVRILRESIHRLEYKNDFIIYDEEDVLKLLKTCLEELDIVDKKMDPKTFRTLISRAKNNNLTPEDTENTRSSSTVETLFPQVYSRYQFHLKEYQALDFDDLLFLTVKLFREHPDVLEIYQERWEYLLIDEYQDTNQAQYEIVKKLVGKKHNLCVVGDPDQSIYSWRGANVENILNFESDFQGAKVIRLEQNYRSRQNILEAANELIDRNRNRFEKFLWSDLGLGEKIKQYTSDSEQNEARFVADRIRYYQEEKGIPLREMVVFYRTNAQSRAFEDRLLFNRIPYVIVGGISFYQRREIKDILAFLRMVQSGSDFISFSRTINVPKRGIGGATIEKIRVGAIQEGQSILEYCHSLIKEEQVLFPVRLTNKQKTGLKDYLHIIETLKQMEEISIQELVKGAIQYSGYLGYLKEDQETYSDRKENLDALIAKAVEWEQVQETPSLSAFLEELSLKSTLDETTGFQDRLNLMTVHNGKGLEFTVVFLAGMEEGIFPHINSRDSEEGLEEERRLCYVGMTRAKEYLYLTNSSYRFLWGMQKKQYPSRFLREVSSKYIKEVSFWAD